MIDFNPKDAPNGPFASWSTPRSVPRVPQSRASVSLQVSLEAEGSSVSGGSKEYGQLCRLAATGRRRRSGAAISA